MTDSPHPDEQRYVVISSDCHAGAWLPDYRPYLPSSFHDQFDAWASTYEVPYADLTGPDGSKNWDSDRRLADLEAEGVVAEVIYPNTIPPFFPKSSLTYQPPGPLSGDLAQRWAGLQAHNRWLAEFCAMAPGRRAGICQIMVHDIEAAVAEVRWARGHGLFGGVLMPGTPPGSGLPPLHDGDYYEPLFAACADLGMPLHLHGGGFNPPMSERPEGPVVFMLEVTWWGNRTLSHLILSGALQRHPNLQIVFTEQGSAWVPGELARLDYFFTRMRTAKGSQEYEWGRDVMAGLPLQPSEYFARQCHLGASFMRPAEAAMIAQIGADRIMWGTDYPHKEASSPYTTEALRAAFAAVEPSTLAKILGANAAALFGFDLDALGSVAQRIGPTVAEIATPLQAGDVPLYAEKCPALVGFGAR